MSSPNSGFNEYYAPDGTIYGQGYEENGLHKKARYVLPMATSQLVTKSV